MIPVKLNEILQQRKVSLERTKQKIPLSKVKHRAAEEKPGPDFLRALQLNQDLNDLSVIGEYKPASPSRGHISNFNVEEVVETYQEGGITAISILTEEKFFKSNLKNLKTASKLSLKPVIRKDFILDEYQIYEARGAGASSLLLLASLYPDLEEGIMLTRDMGMEPLVECSNREELNLAKKAGARIIGINNRNFQDFSIDLNRTLQLAPHVPSDILLVSESGVNGSSKLRSLAESGADAVLVGSSLMLSNNIEDLYYSVKSLVESSRGARRER